MTRSIKLLLGILGGLSATAPMTATMLTLHRRLPAPSRYPLPPREITSKITNGSLSDGNESLLTLLAHFSYGATMGGIYAGVVRRPEHRWVVKGGIAAVIVWAVSYLVLLPVVRVLRPGHEHPPERSFLMIVAHFVWGLTLGGFLAAVLPDSSRGLVGKALRPQRDHA